MRRNNPKSYGDPAMDRNATMDRRLRKRLRNLPTKQNHNTQEEDTALSYHHQRRHSPFPTNCDGPDHRTSTATQIQCHTNHSRSWMFTSGHLPPLFRHHYRSGHRAALLGLCLPMVWSTNQNDKRPRSQIHLTVWQSPFRETWDRTKSLHGIPSPNRWTIGTKESMDQTIPPVGNVE